MSQKTLWIVSGSLLVAGFLFGFVPQYSKGVDLQQQLVTAREEAATAREKSERRELGLMLGEVYLQTNLKNFGLAGQLSTKFFDTARAMSDQTSDPSWKTLLQSVLSQRDAITAGLAKADPATLEVVQGTFQRMLEAAEMK